MPKDIFVSQGTYFQPEHGRGLEPLLPLCHNRASHQAKPYIQFKKMRFTLVQSHFQIVLILLSILLSGCMKQKTAASDPSISGGGGIPGYVLHPSKIGMFQPVDEELELSTLLQLGACPSLMPTQLYIITQAGAVEYTLNGSPVPIEANRFSVVAFDVLNPAPPEVIAPVHTDGSFGINRAMLDAWSALSPRPPLSTSFPLGTYSFIAESLGRRALQVIDSLNPQELSVSNAHGWLDIVEREICPAFDSGGASGGSDALESEGSSGGGSSALD